MATGTPFQPTPFSTTIVGPQTASAFRRAPYISISEYRFAPTAVSTNALVSGSFNQGPDSSASLAMVIDRASAWVDEICFHRPEGTLAASETTESQAVTAKAGGTLALQCNFYPILEVTGLAVGANPSNLNNISQQTANNIWINGTCIYVPAGAFIGPNGDVPIPEIYVGWGNCFVVWTYINGYPHATLAADATQGATELTLTAAIPGPLLGIYPGTQLTINDGSSTEIVVASAVPSGNVVSLQAGTTYAHTVPAVPDATMVTALPRVIEQATIMLTSCLIKTQGTRAMQLPQAPGGMPKPAELGQAGVLEDFRLACRMLKPYIIPWLHG